jgi:hypothetical protein
LDGFDADAKPIITWHLGKPTRGDAQIFVRDLAWRVMSDRVQIAADGLGAYNEPIQRFDHHGDDGSEVKDFGLLDDDAPTASIAQWSSNLLYVLQFGAFPILTI